MNIHNILLWMNSGMEMPALTVNGILNSAFFHSSPHINQMLRQIFHALHFCTLDSLLNYATDFVVDWIEVTAVWRPQIWKFIGVTKISEIIALPTGGSNWRTNSLGNTQHAEKITARTRSSADADKPARRVYTGYGFLLIIY